MNIILLTITKLFIIIFLGFYLYRRKVLGDEALRFLTSFIINLSVPFLIFSNIITSFNPESMPSVWIFLILSIFIFLLGLVLASLFSFTVSKKLRREFLSLVSFQNGGYLPMNIAIFLLPQHLKETFLTYIFLYLLGFNILMWSVASFFIFRKRNEEFKFHSILTPPVLSIIMALAVIYLGLGRFIPQFIISPLKMIGETSFVLSMIVLGAWLARSKLNISLNTPLISKIIILKLIILPLFVFVGILKWHIFSLFGLFILMEASMPSAASLPIVANLRGADSEFTSQGVFFTHLLSIITVPLWIGIFLKLYNFTF